MTPLVPIAIFGWAPVVLLLFAVLPPKRAALTGYFLAWMFLPIAGFKVQGLPPADKVSVTAAATLLGMVLMDPSSLARLRLGLWDLPITVWMLAPLPSAVTNGFGTYEGVSGVISQAFTWGVPYVVGRAYISDERGLRDFVHACVLGGLLYVPLALFEVRMSPILHTWVYGFHQHVFAQSKRGDGFRPTVFMQHGLAVALFFATASVGSFWLWVQGGARRFGPAPMWLAVGVLCATTLLCKSMYACVLMVLGCLALSAGLTLRTRWPLFLLASVPVLYLVLRGSGTLNTEAFDSVVSFFGGERGGSLSIRLTSEDFLLKTIGGHMLFGVGRMELVFREALDDQTKFICDGLWLYALGKYGIVGLASLFGTLVLPAVLVFARFRTWDRGVPARAAVMVAAVTLLMYAMDSLLNGMINPLYLMGAGGLVGWAGREAAPRVNAALVAGAGAPANAAGRWVHHGNRNFQR